MPDNVRVHLDESELDLLAAKLPRTRLPTIEPATWNGGTPAQWLSEVIDEWRAFDPSRLQATLDRLDHVIVDIDGVTIHAVHVAGVGDRSAPLLLTHGWPSSVLEYLRLLPLLSHPTAGGDDGAQRFTVVAASLPGYGFSGPPPPDGFTHTQVAELWHKLMVDVFGFNRYFAHGSDLGAGVTARLARLHPEAVAAIHLATPGLGPPPEPRADSVVEHFEELESWEADEGAYAHMHSTKPSTLAAALVDSPAGLAAWIGEKWVGWSSTHAGQPAFDREILLSTLTLYWVTRTAGTALLPYWAHRRGTSPLPPDDPPPVPTVIDIFGGEAIPFPKPPRELAERYFDLAGWAEHPRGGHFPAMAEPELLAGQLRKAFGPYIPTL